MAKTYLITGASEGIGLEIARQAATRWRAAQAGTNLAESDTALIVEEQDHAQVVYSPPSDLRPGALVAVSVPETFCPYKGMARYWASAAAPGVPIAWSYDIPYADVAGIAGHVAFYPHAVTVVPVGAAGEMADA